MKFFSNNHQQEALHQLQHTLEAITQRLQTFLNKLDERADLLLQGFIQEAPSILANDTPYQQAYSRFLAATRGQLNTLRKKAEEVRESQLQATYDQYRYTYDTGSPLSNLAYDWYQLNQDRLRIWEENLHKKEEQAITQASYKDYEKEFQQLMADYNQQKEKVYCKQCGSKMEITSVYYYSTYIACPFCFTQNIFDPGTSARLLESSARQLAEQRSLSLLNEWQQAKQNERDLYMQAHTLKLSLIHEKNNQTIQAGNHTLQELEAQRQEAIQQAPLLQQAYYRNIFDEMNRLLPDLKEHNERFYESIRTSYLQQV